MKIYNSGYYFTNEQLGVILDRLGDSYEINHLYIIEKRRDIIKYGLIFLNIIDFISILLGKLEGNFVPTTKSVMVYVYAQNEYKNYQSSQLYSLHALLHELCHAYYHNIKKEESEEDCDNFATNYLNKNSKFFSKVMDWKDEWEVEEED